jgi:hypothetical protein
MDNFPWDRIDLGGEVAVRELACTFMWNSPRCALIHRYGLHTTGDLRKFGRLFAISDEKLTALEQEREPPGKPFFENFPDRTVSTLRTKPRPSRLTSSPENGTERARSDRRRSPCPRRHPARRPAHYARRMPQRRFPPPWRFEPIPGGYRVIDANGLALAHVYGEPPNAIAMDKRLTNNEAEKIARLRPPARACRNRARRRTQAPAAMYPMSKK